MCGIVGAAGTLDQRAEKMFKGLLEVDTTRGRHSTGIFYATRYPLQNETCKIEKHLGTPWDFYDAMNRNYLIPGSPKVLIGHNRAATLGEVTIENAHPFNFGSIYGVHNGTLRSWNNLEGASEFEVDSQALYNHISKRGLQDALNNCYGAFALVWWDEEKKLLNFVRNAQRPLYFVFTEDNKTMFWASEYWMLESQADRFNIKIGEIFKFNDEVHCQLEIPDRDKVFEKFKTKAVKERKPPAVTRQNHYGLGGRYQGSFQGGQTNNVLPFNKSKKEIITQQGKGRMLSHLNKEITFRPSGKVKSVTKSYIYGCLVGDPQLIVRVHVDPTEPLWDEMDLGQGLRFSGRVKRVNSRDDYMLIDRRSVQQLSSKGWVNKILREHEREEELRSGGDYLPIDNSRIFVPEMEWLRRTSDGCAWCSSPFRTEEAEELHWMQGGEIICPDCQKIDDVKQFIIN